MKMFRRKDEGFTLVELMVVILIIGILVAIAIPVFNAARASAQTRTCQANLRTIAGAIQAFNADRQVWPANVAALAAAPTTGQAGPFLQRVPVCPNPDGAAYDDWDATVTPPVATCEVAGHEL